MSADTHEIPDVTVAGRELLDIIQELEAEEAAIRDHNKVKSDIIKEAGGKGWDKKTIRKVMAARRLDPLERSEQDDLFDMYMQAVEKAEKSLVHARVENAGKFGAAQPAIDNQEQPETANEIHERPSINDEAYLEAGPQAETSLAGTGSRTLADREGRSEGEAASADLPTNSSSTAGPHLSAVSGGKPSIPSSTDGGAKMEGADTAIPDRPDDKSDFTRAKAEQAATNSHSSDDTHVETDKAGALQPSQAAPATLSDADVPAFLVKTHKPFRSHCQRPELCGSGTRDHCYSCKKAMAESEAA